MVDILDNFPEDQQKGRRRRSSRRGGRGCLGPQPCHCALGEQQVWQQDRSAD